MAQHNISGASWKLDQCTDTSCILKASAPVDGPWTDDVLTSDAGGTRGRDGRGPATERWRPRPVRGQLDPPMSDDGEGAKPSVRAGPGQHHAAEGAARVGAAAAVRRCAGSRQRAGRTGARLRLAAQERAEGDATAFRIFGDDMLLVNMSTWTSVEALHDYVYRTAHVGIMRRRREFALPVGAGEVAVALWWVAAGHRPTVKEAEERLRHLRAHGPTPFAFSPRSSFPPAPSSPMPTVRDDDTCWVYRRGVPRMRAPALHEPSGRSDESVMARRPQLRAIFVALLLRRAARTGEWRRRPGEGRLGRRVMWVGRRDPVGTGGRAGQMATGGAGTGGTGTGGAATGGAARRQGRRGRRGGRLRDGRHHRRGRNGGRGGARRNGRCGRRRNRRRGGRQRRTRRLRPVAGGAAAPAARRSRCSPTTRSIRRPARRSPTPPGNGHNGTAQGTVRSRPVRSATR